MTVRVLIADDQRLVRAGFRLILERQPGVEVVGEATNGAEAVALTERLSPDVVLMDIRMPDGEDPRSQAPGQTRFAGPRPGGRLRLRGRPRRPAAQTMTSGLPSRGSGPELTGQSRQPTPQLLATARSPSRGREMTSQRAPGFHGEDPGPATQPWQPGAPSRRADFVAVIGGVPGGIAGEHCATTWNVTRRVPGTASSAAPM